MPFEKTPPPGASKPIFTVGHSTRTLEDFVHLLQAHGVTLLVDVRTMPRSRRNPQFNMDRLPSDLEKAAIRYTHIPALGGLRHAKSDSPNTGWRNASFRGFADHMQSADFQHALEKLASLLQQDQVVIMCAEAVPWRCHRSLIADALLARGIPAEHIMTPKQRHPHKLTPFARLQGASVLYPAADSETPNAAA